MLSNHFENKCIFQTNSTMSDVLKRFPTKQTNTIPKTEEQNLWGGHGVFGSMFSKQFKHTKCVVKDL
jgi:hypothetical protein